MKKTIYTLALVCVFHALTQAQYNWIGYSVETIEYIEHIDGNAKEGFYVVTCKKGSDIRFGWIGVNAASGDQGKVSQISSSHLSIFLTAVTTGKLVDLNLWSSLSQSFSGYKAIDGKTDLKDVPRIVAVKLNK